MRRLVFVAPALLSLIAAVGCSSGGSEPVGDEDDFSSNQAVLLDFDFDGELVTDSSWNDKGTIQDQLLYTMGHLNADNSVGRLDKLTLTNIRKTEAGGKVTLKYHATLPVAWGGKRNLPTSYEFLLPRDNSREGLEQFVEKHKTSCVNFGAHDVEVDSMWYDYRPKQAGCRVTDPELVKTTATVQRSPENTTGTYPEYQKVWEDNLLEVVAIFGKYEASGQAGDEGVSAFNRFVGLMTQQLGSQRLVTTPANVSASPGPSTKDVTFEATLADGKKVKVTALLVDSITSVWPGFKERYETLTPTADLVAYNGHSGLGQNVRALGQMGKWSAGKYQIFFMNGCDSFAYVDGSLAQSRARLNPDDPTGTKYMEFVTNAMPSYFSSMAAATGTLVSGLMSYAQPNTYDKIFTGIDNAEVVLVTGEEDNVFRPGMRIGSP